ncbi:MAG: hypothetical protein EBU97_01105 [Rhodobacteraceae bacterium]|nr:hypothetical protein [Paracoccaceae bacterium]
MSACEMGASCCKSSPCAYWAVDGNAEELAALRAKVERLREALSPLVAVIPDICNALDVDPDETSIRVRVDGGAPSVFMGGPSERNKKRAREALAAVIPAIQNAALDRAEVERLRRALRSIANQKLQTEMQEDEYPIADFHGAYGAIVKAARAALAKEPGNEG